MAYPDDEKDVAGTDQDGPVQGSEPEMEQELAFADEEEQLPWLEVDDDYEEPGVDTRRIITFGLVALLGLAVIIGAIWFFTRDGSGGVPIADGSTIEAPDEPYKTKPEDPGGREVAGTGDSSFQVAEGKTVEGRVADETVKEPVPAATSGPSINLDQPGSKTTPIGVGVQVGAYSSKAIAEKGWGELTGRYDVLSGVSHRVIEGQVDGATIYRLQAVPGDRAAAESLCRSLKAAGGDCQVKP